MTIYLYIFRYRGQEVTYTILARNKTVANRLARERERLWRLAVDASLKEH